MLTICKVSNPSYYVNWAEENYYINDKSNQGVWRGYLKHIFRLPDVVEIEAYTNLLAGKSPDGKKTLVQQNGKTHHGATDCCFSAPKSISLIMVTENRKEIIEAHEQAVNSAISFIEEHAAFSRRGRNGIYHEKISGLLVSKHTHYESRANQPQLHTHCLIYNLCVRDDGTTGAIASKYLFKWKMAAGAIYRSELAHNIQKLGYQIKQDGDFFEVKGISNDLIKEYSAREKEIAELQQRLRLKNTSNKLGDRISLQTRSKKSNTGPTELFEGWKKELINRVTPKRSLVKGPAIGNTYVLPNQAIQLLTEQKSYFREQDLYQRLAIQGQQSFLNSKDIDSIASKVLQGKKVVYLGQNKNLDQCYTTKDVLNAEILMIEQAKKLSQSVMFRQTESKLSFDKGISIAQLELGFDLEDEQLEAVKLASNSKQLTLLQGTAGTGKSTSFRAAMHVYATQGLSIIGSSVSKKAADSLEESAGIESFTVDMLIKYYQTSFNPLKKHAALIVDEASQLSISQLNTLMKMALESQTKLILAGDIFQLQAISNPGAFNYLLKNNIAINAQLENIRRQSEDWAKELVNQLKEGNSAKATSTMSIKKLINFSDGHENTINKLVDKYFKLEAQQPEKNRLILAKSWKDVKAINQSVRNQLKSDNKLSRDLVTLECVVSDKVFEQSFAIGDRVRLSKNDYQKGLTNGTQGKIKDIFKSKNSWYFKLILDDGRVTEINSSTYCTDEYFFPMVHAYASTIYSSQGLTVNGDSLILANSNFDRSNAYVAGSRHKQNCYWFINSNDIDIELLDTKKIINETNRLEVIGNWFAKDSKECLAIELINDTRALSTERRNMKVQSI